MFKLPFKQRFNIDLSKPLEQDFPESGRVALAYLIDELVEMASIRGYKANPMMNEMLRTARLTYEEFDFNGNTALFYRIVTILKRMEWWQVYTFCERLHERHIDAAGCIEDDSFVETNSKAEMQRYFEAELNTILNFTTGHFLSAFDLQRIGRPQGAATDTEKSLQRLDLQRLRALFTVSRGFQPLPTGQDEKCPVAKY